MVNVCVFFLLLFGDNVAVILALFGAGVGTRFIQFCMVLNCGVFAGVFTVSNCRGIVPDCGIQMVLHASHLSVAVRGIFFIPSNGITTGKTKTVRGNKEPVSKKKVLYFQID